MIDLDEIKQKAVESTDEMVVLLARPGYVLAIIDALEAADEFHSAITCGFPTAEQDRCCSLLGQRLEVFKVRGV